MNRTRYLAWRVLTPPIETIPVDPSAVSRLINAALVDGAFEHRLLTDPAAALADGYNGESFHLADEDRGFILSIRAASLSDFAMQWVEHRKNGGGSNSYHHDY